MQHHGGGAAPPPPPPPPPPSGGVYAQPPQQQPKDGIPYIGSRISLISKTDIRYEGFLFNIDTRQSMVALQHVRSFGTEGRRTEHIPPLDQILPFATFKASEIKDLHVCEAAPPVYGYGHPPPPPPMPHMPAPPLPPQHHAPPPPPPSAPAPPAPRQPTAPPASPPKKAPSPPKAKPSTGPTLLTPGSVSQAATRQPASPQVHVQHASSPAPEHAAAAQRSGGSRTIPGMGDHLLKRRERRVPGGGDPTSVTSGNDFNFENGLNDFDKEEEFNKLSLDDNKAKGSYQKSSFFDTISCDALDRLEGKQGRVTASEERKLNTETFGAVGLNNRRSFRGGRGGGGRGGGRRGGGGRGGRGGNNNRNGSWNRNGGGRRDGNLP